MLTIFAIHFGYDDKFYVWHFKFIYIHTHKHTTLWLKWSQSFPSSLYSPWLPWPCGCRNAYAALTITTFWIISMVRSRVITSCSCSQRIRWPLSVLRVHCEFKAHTHTLSLSRALSTPHISVEHQPPFRTPTFWLWAQKFSRAAVIHSCGNPWQVCRYTTKLLQSKSIQLIIIWPGYGAVFASSHVAGNCAIECAEWGERVREVGAGRIFEENALKFLRIHHSFWNIHWN